MPDLVHTIHYMEDYQLFFRRVMYAFKNNRIAGDYVEFGSCGATTFRFAFGESRKAGIKPHLWSFDSFKGLPPSADTNEHPLWTEGAMAMPIESFVRDCLNAGMTTDDFSVVEGFYSDTLAPDVVARAAYPKDIALAYVDCDLYSSTKDVLGFLSTRLKHGMVIALDDYYCWWDRGVAGERVAFEEFKSAHPQYNFLPYMQIGWHGQSFIVEDRTYLDWTKAQQAR